MEAADAYVPLNRLRSAGAYFVAGADTKRVRTGVIALRAMGHRLQSPRDAAMHLSATFLLRVVTLIATVFTTSLARADLAPGEIGVVLMHGKGGAPTGVVKELAASLEEQGGRVANLEMPWSSHREYDASVSDAVKQVDDAIAALRSKGVKKVFVAGHSQGGVFAFYYASQRPVDGVIGIAPGGNAAATVVRDALGATVERARKLVAEGKGDEKGTFSDWESSRGKNDVHTTAAIYLTWFDPDGAMNQMNAERGIDPEVPVLFIAPKGDYPGLKRFKSQMFDALPPNPKTRMYEPDTSHIGAPAASRSEIWRWMVDVARSQ